MVLRFSEPVEILNRSDVTVVNHAVQKVDIGAPRTAAGDPRRVVIPLRGPLLPESYTVRYRVVSADSHSAVEAFVFASGGARLGPPIWAGAGGLSDTARPRSAPASPSSSRSGCCSACSAFRVLVWGPAMTRRARTAGRRS